MRTRLIHPEFFSSATLARLPIEARFLFAGLWCMADREGLLLDSAKKIAGDVFPHDETRDSRQVNRWLEMLASGDSPCIRRYEASGKKCIQIINFHGFQKPHERETKSSLPPPRQTLGAPKADLRQAEGEPVSVSVSVAVSESVSECVRGDSGTVHPPAKSTPTPGQPSARIPPSPRKANRKRPLRYDPVAILGAQTLMYHFVRRACDHPVRDWEPPDERLAEKFLDAAKGNLDWLTGFMAELERSGRKPERSYAWFVAMAHKVVAGEPVFLSGKGKLALMPPSSSPISSPAPAESDERKSEAM